MDNQRFLNGNSKEEILKSVDLEEYYKRVEDAVLECFLSGNTDSTTREMILSSNKRLLMKFFLNEFGEEFEEKQRQKNEKLKKEENKEKAKGLRRRVSETLLLAIVVGLITEIVVLNLKMEIGFTVKSMVVFVFSIAYVLYFLFNDVLDFLTNLKDD